MSEKIDKAIDKLVEEDEKKSPIITKGPLAVIGGKSHPTIDIDYRDESKPIYRYVIDSPFIHKKILLYSKVGNTGAAIKTAKHENAHIAVQKVDRKTGRKID